MTKDEAEKMVRKYKAHAYAADETDPDCKDFDAVIVRYHETRAALIAALTATNAAVEVQLRLMSAEAEFQRKFANAETARADAIEKRVAELEAALRTIEDEQAPAASGARIIAEESYTAMLAAAPPAPAVITRAVTTAAPDHIPDAGKMVADAVAAELEACAKIVDEYAKDARLGRDDCDVRAWIEPIADAIRARGKGGAT